MGQRHSGSQYQARLDSASTTHPSGQAADAMNEITLEADDVEHLLELIHGFRVSQAIYVIATLGIPDLLGDRCLTCRELAERTETHPRALYRVLRTLAATSLLREHDNETFSLTRVGRYLRGDVQGSRNAWVRNALRPAIWQAWGHLLHSVRTGETAFGHIHGKDVWQFRAHSPEDSAIFDLAMREGSLRVGADLLARYDFTRFRHIVDVGGGDGTLLSSLLADCVETSGTLFDQAHVVANAADVFRGAGVQQRCGIVAGSFFDAVPAGANAYLLKFILHDWDDDHCVRILANCGRAMDEHSKLLIVERLLAPPNKGLESKLSDLSMMVGLGGQERSQEEFYILIRRAGLTLRRVIALPGCLALLEVERALRG